MSTPECNGKRDSDHNSEGDVMSKIDNLTQTAPERIYLLVDNDLATGNTPDVFPDNEWAVSWTTEHQKGTVEYVRADLVPTWKAAPDSPGVWADVGGWMREFYVEADGLWSDDIDRSYCATFDEFVSDTRWFGPIPEDK